MPFRVQIFQENVERLVGGTARAELVRICEEYAGLTTPRQKTQSIHTMMTELDMLVMEETRQDIMEMCGRRCIGTSTLQKARQLKQAATSLDDWLDQLNNAHIGGGHLWREGNIIHATYERCYCGSVNKAKETFSGTYCRCSCGWYRQLFETILDKPVEVELLSSIIQGDENCRFLIRIPLEAG